ncbi:hypothetical protein ACWGJ2_17775 [Streptomyces sp. NPDC054796]
MAMTAAGLRMRFRGGFDGFDDFGVLGVLGVFDDFDDFDSFTFRLLAALRTDERY